MDYNDFFESVRRYQTERVKALYFDSCCSTSAIPSHVLLFVPQVVQLLHKHHVFLSMPDQVIYWFGLQACAVVLAPYVSESVEEQNRETPLCCVIKYLVLDRQAKQPATWDPEHNLVVNFTTGELMDNQHYLSRVFNLGTPGRVYGRLNGQEANDTVFNRVSPQALSMVY